MSADTNERCNGALLVAVGGGSRRRDVGVLSDPRIGGHVCTSVYGLRSEHSGTIAERHDKLSRSWQIGRRNWKQESGTIVLLQSVFMITAHAALFGTRQMSCS